MPKQRNKSLKKVCLFLDMDAIAKAKLAAIRKGLEPSLAGHTSALLRYLVEDFTKKSGQ